VRFSVEGPGKVLGVGNGDPSCHEPDVYLGSKPIRRVEIDGWRMAEVTGRRDRPETAEVFDDSAWAAADISQEGGPLRPDRTAVYRARATVAEADLAAEGVDLAFGRIDDDGWVFVNGQPAGESHDWSASPAFDVRKLLRPGPNTIAVLVRNRQGQGGLGGGAAIRVREKPVAPDWKRSVFNGLAQVIVKAGREPGEIRLTARSEGLRDAVLSIPSRARPLRPSAP
jgi:beta-galactosidase